MALKIYIASSSGLSVESFIPEDFTFQQDHEWENPYKVDMSPMLRSVAQWVSGGKFSGSFDPAQSGKYLGIDAYTYMGSSPFTLNLELEFVINSDINKELRLPVKKLMYMSCPSGGGGLGSFGSLGKPNFVHIRIPNVLEIKKALITSVGSTLMKPLVTDGKVTSPLKARVPLTIIMSDIFTIEKVNERLFPGVDVNEKIQ